MPMTQYQVNVAAEAYVAATLSQAGYDVAMQYGTTQPDWDILAKKTNRILQVQVKGSQDGGWPLCPSHLVNADYHGAIDAWLALQLPDIVYFFVQFQDVAIGAALRCYIVRPPAIAAHMHTTRAGHRNTALLENYAYVRGVGAGYNDQVPQEWALSADRVDNV